MNRRIVRECLLVFVLATLLIILFMYQRHTQAIVPENDIFGEEIAANSVRFYIGDNTRSPSSIVEVGLRDDEAYIRSTRDNQGLNTKAITVEDWQGIVLLLEESGFWTMTQEQDSGSQEQVILDGIRWGIAANIEGRQRKLSGVELHRKDIPPMMISLLELGNSLLTQRREKGLPGIKIREDVAGNGAKYIVSAISTTGAMESIRDTGPPRDYPEGDVAFQYFKVVDILEGELDREEILVRYAFAEIHNEDTIPIDASLLLYLTEDVAIDSGYFLTKAVEISPAPASD